MNERARETSIVGSIFAVSCVPPLFGVLWMAVESGNYWFHFLALAVGSVAGLLTIVRRSRRGRSTGFFLTLAILNMIVVTPEVLLRVLRFHHESGIEFGYPRGFQRFARDPDLFWTLPPNSPGVNSIGFRGPEISAKTPGTCRFLFLGDSVVAQGYAKTVGAGLGARLPDLPLETVELALPGYSSFQGRALVEKYAGAVAPDVVLVSYGWNDHWLARGAVDSRKIIDARRSPAQRVFDAIYRRARTLQWLTRFLVPDRPMSEVRVSIREYADNLNAIGTWFAERRVPVVFVTAPTSHHRLGVPDYLVDHAFAVSKQEVVALHRAYNESLRELAGSNDWLVLDLERILEDSPDLARLFTEDGIHLTAEGLEVVGGAIAELVYGVGCLVPVEIDATSSQPPPSGARAARKRDMARSP